MYLQQDVIINRVHTNYSLLLKISVCLKKGLGGYLATHRPVDLRGTSCEK